MTYSKQFVIVLYVL